MLSIAVRLQSAFRRGSRSSPQLAGFKITTGNIYVVKCIRSSDVGGIPATSLHSLGALLQGNIVNIADGIEIHSSPYTRSLANTELVTAASLPDFAKIWPTIENSGSLRRLDLRELTERKREASARLKRRAFGDFIWPIALVDPSKRFTLLNEVLLPEFFAEYPNGQVRLITIGEAFTRSLSILSILQRAKVLQTGDLKVLQKYAGSTPLSSFSLSNPEEALFYFLSFGFLWTYPKIYGFVGTCQHQRFLAFILDKPHEVTVEESTEFERLTPGLGNVMNTLQRSPLAPINYAPSARTYPLDRRRFGQAETIDYFERYVAAVDSTLVWLSDFDNFGSTNDLCRFDVEFCYAVWLTVFVLLVTQFGILEDRRQFSRKLSFYDTLELLAALITSSSGSQADAWKTLASDDFARSVVHQQVLRFGPAFGAELGAAVAAIRSDAERIVNEGLIYPKLPGDLISIPGKSGKGTTTKTLQEFEPALYRALRNTRHGFAIRNSELLSIHTGEIHNDLPDLGIAMFLGFLADKTPYLLARS